MNQITPINNNNPTVEDLVKNARKGDNTAFAALIRIYTANLYAYIRNITNGTGIDAEDVVQETFIRAFSKINNYNKKFTFSTWLYAIGRNIAIDAIRKANIIHSPNMPTHSDEKPNSADSSILENEEKNMIWQLVHKLEKNLQEVIWLRYAQSHSIEEIAQITGRTEIYVKVLLYRARNALGKMISKEISVEATEIKRIAAARGLISETGGRL